MTDPRAGALLVALRAAETECDLAERREISAWRRAVMSGPFGNDREWWVAFERERIENERARALRAAARRLGLLGDG